MSKKNSYLMLGQRKISLCVDWNAAPLEGVNQRSVKYCASTDGVVRGGWGWGGGWMDMTWRLVQGMHAGK